MIKHLPHKVYFIVISSLKGWPAKAKDPAGQQPKISMSRGIKGSKKNLETS